MKVRKSILSIKPYEGGKPISQLQHDTGIADVVKLASNENPLSAGEKVLVAVASAIKEINRYPDFNGLSLKQTLSTHLGINKDRITLGNGSNDVLELVARAYVYNSDDEVIFSQYAFVVYALITQALGVKAVVTPADDFAHDLEAMLAAISDNTKIIFIANPNNPTGTLLSDDAVYNFLLKVPAHIIVVLDQAYFEYLQIKDNACKYLDEFANLVITRSFSKAYGLAGLRVGYALSSSIIAEYLNRIRQPFNVNSIAIAAATAVLNDADYLQQSIAINNNGMQQLASTFEQLGLEYIHSFTNFIAVKINNTNDVYQKLLNVGIIVRPVEMQGYLRVSIGTQLENDKFIKALKLIL